jgi:hypothetical protein
MQNEIPEHLPGEPEPQRASSALRAVRLVRRAIVTLVVAALTLWLWPAYLVLAALYGRAPNVPRLRQVARYLRATWTAELPPPGLSHYERAWLTISILRLAATIPLFGVAWLLDELIYGGRLREVRIVAPLIEISAGRSGSTQLARYLEEDPRLVAPPMIHCMFPFLWAWRLVPRTVGRFVAAEQLKERMSRSMPESMRERHEGDPFRTDTFEIALLGRHLNHLSLRLGPQAMADDFSFGPIAPHNRALWESDFVRLFDGVARKTLLNAGPGPDGAPRRLFIKGHFLGAADFLARLYPDATFLTVIREPAPRLQSAVNFLRSTPFDESMGGPAPWAWLGAAIEKSETAYCEMEQEWFTRERGPRRCIVRFADYVRDLEGTMTRIYRECFDAQSLPPWVPRTHAPRKRHGYTYDRSLAAVGIDQEALDARLASYITWCRGDA